MNYRSLILAAMFVLIVFLAFILSDVVEATIIVPLAYLWWLLKLYYAALPQFIFWIILVVAVLYSAITNLIPEIRARKTEALKSKPAEGHIEILAEWIKKSRRGTYHKWLIANRLGKDAREILAQRDGNPVSKKFGMLTGRDWNPPHEIESYLESGLNGSFADFPRPRWSLRENPQPTPLDVDARQVMDYLENEMEMAHGRDHKSI